MLKKSVLFALLAATAAAHADTLYSNVNSATNTTTFTNNYAHDADDFQFGALGSTYNPTVNITGLQLGFVNSAASAVDFDMVVNFYQDMDVTSTTSTNILSGLAKSYRFSFTGVLPGTNFTGLLDLSLYGGGFTLPAVSDFATRNHGVEVTFFTASPNHNSTTLDTDMSLLFKGNQDPTAGYSYDRYYRNRSTNPLAASDKGDFGGGNTRANAYMQLVGQPVPEPMSLAPLALGAVAFLRRRRRA